MRLNLDKVQISQADIDKALSMPSDFGYSGDLPMFETWSLGPIIQTRDSSLLDKSNALALTKYLDHEHADLAEDWEITKASHWAVGHVDHFSFRVVNEDGTPTKIFKVITAWFKSLDDYPVANESLYSEMENEASWENIEQEGTRIARKHDYNLPDDWQSKIMDYFDANDHGALESRDDQGAWPSEDQFLAAFEACEFNKESDDE